MSCAISGKPAEASSLAQLVAAFLKEDGCCPREEMRMFQGLPIEDAVRKAALARDERGKLFRHQWNLKEKFPKVPSQAERILSRCVDEIAACSGFDELHESIRRELKVRNRVFGAGELYIYDTAFRIGISRGLYPEKVYLHAGTRDGATALGIYNGKDVLEMSELPEELKRLKPYQVEDFLCLKKEVLHKFRRGMSD